MKWSAKFDATGFVSIEPDTPETRRDLAQTLHDFHGGHAEVDEEKTHWTAPLPVTAANQT